MSTRADASTVRPVPVVRRRRFAALVMLGALGGCYSWHPVTDAVDDDAGAGKISHAVVVLRDSSELMLRDVEIRADSVVGRSTSGRTRKGVSRADVARVERRELSGLGRYLLIYGIAVPVAVTLFLTTMNPY